MIRQYAGLVKFAHTIFAMPFALVGFVYALRFYGRKSNHFFRQQNTTRARNQPPTTPEIHCFSPERYYLCTLLYKDFTRQ